MQRSKRSPTLLLLSLLILAGCSDQFPMEPRLDSPLAPTSSPALNLQVTPPGYIRIGVVPSAASVTIGSAGAWTLVDKAGGGTLYSGTAGSVAVNLLTAGEVRTRDWIQVTCTGSTTTRDDLLTRAAAAGFEAYTEAALRADGSVICWRVRFGTLPARTAVTGSPQQPTQAGLDFQARLQASGLPNTGLWYTVTKVTGESQLQLVYGEIEKIATGPVVLRAPGANVTINDQPYRGVAEVWTNSGGTLAGINELPIEQYLYGVVPRELPPVPYGLMEAQKAQAVTARTYALANLGKRRTDGYDLLPTTSDQVYGGFEAEHPVSTQAVDATRGVVAVSGGQLITTLYHSTSGGYTANSEDVYTNYFSYLRGVPDAERGQAVEHVPTLEVFKRAANPTNLRAAAGGDFEADWSRYHRWVVEWTAAEMAEALSSSFGVPVSQVYEINVPSRASCGRALEMQFVTDAGTLVGLKDQIRSRLRYFTATGTLASLRSTMVFVEPVTDPKTKAITGWKAYGGGWGHGVGMSQTGAVGMAERGRTYEQILKHYYQGIELQTRQY
jgi:stage II sporulation protein D